MWQLERTTYQRVQKNKKGLQGSMTQSGVVIELHRSLVEEEGSWRKFNIQPFNIGSSAKKPKICKGR
jgi:hypothetical protein